MIITFINLLLAIVGSLALAVAVFILIDQPLQCMWSRHWLRQRLDITPVSQHLVEQVLEPLPSQQAANQNLATDVLITEEMANLLDAISREMRLGRSLTAAFLYTHYAFPLLTGYVQPIAQACERGVSLADALRASQISATSSTMPSSVVFGSRALWAATTGSSGTLALERAASTLRERSAIRFERHAQSAQARLSIQILTWLPMAFLGWQIITNPLARLFLLASPAGWAFLIGGLGLNWYGRRWMNRVVQGPAL